MLPYVLINEKPLLRNEGFVFYHPILSTTKVKPQLIWHSAILGRNSRGLHFLLPSLSQGLTNETMATKTLISIHSLLLDLVFLNHNSQLLSPLLRVPDSITLSVVLLHDQIQMVHTY